MRTTTSIRRPEDDATIVALWDCMSEDLLEQIIDDLDSYDSRFEECFRKELRLKLKYMYMFNQFIQLFRIDRNGRSIEYTIKDDQVTSFVCTIDNKKIGWKSKWIQL